MLIHTRSFLQCVYETMVAHKIIIAENLVKYYTIQQNFSSTRSIKYYLHGPFISKISITKYDKAGEELHNDTRVNNRQAQQL